MSNTSTPAAGWVIEIEGHHVGEPKQTVEIIEVLGSPGHVHYKVRLLVNGTRMVDVARRRAIGEARPFGCGFSVWCVQRWTTLPGNASGAARYVLPDGARPRACGASYHSAARTYPPAAGPPP